MYPLDLVCMGCRTGGDELRFSEPSLGNATEAICKSCYLEQPTTTFTSWNRLPLAQVPRLQARLENAHSKAIEILRARIKALESQLETEHQRRWWHTHDALLQKPNAYQLSVEELVKLANRITTVIHGAPNKEIK